MYIMHYDHSDKTAVTTELLQGEALRGISNNAKVLYALLLDRASISRQNGYVEPYGTIRLYLSRPSSIASAKAPRGFSGRWSTAARSSTVSRGWASPSSSRRTIQQTRS